MNMKFVSYVSILALLYGVGLTLALIFGSDTVKVAVIAVGGTAVGAFAGLIGSVTGARTQATASEAAARLQAESNLRLKRAEVDAAREQLILQEQLNWARKAYDELTELLNISRELGTTVQKYDSWADAVVKLQDIRTRADLLAANPIVGGEPQLSEQVSQYASAITTNSFDDWQVSKGHAPSSKDSKWVPPGELGSRVAKDLGQRIREITADLFKGQTSR